MLCTGEPPCRYNTYGGVPNLIYGTNNPPYIMYVSSAPWACGTYPEQWCAALLTNFHTYILDPTPRPRDAGEHQHMIASRLRLLIIQCGCGTFFIFRTGPAFRSVLPGGDCEYAPLRRAQSYHCLDWSRGQKEARRMVSFAERFRQLGAGASALRWRKNKSNGLIFLKPATRL